MFKKRIFWIVIGLIVVCVFSVRTYLNLQSAEEVKAVADSVNQNIEVLNQNSQKVSLKLEENQNLFDQINTTLSEEGQVNIDPVLAKLDKFQEKEQKFLTLKQETEAEINNLNSGENSDTRKVYNSTKQILRTRAATLNTIPTELEPGICVARSYLLQKKTEAEIDTLTFEANTTITKDSNQEFEQKIKLALQKFPDLKKNLLDLESCFVEKPIDIETIIFKDQATYQLYQDGLQKILEGVTENSLDKLNQGQSLINQYEEIGIQNFSNQEILQVIRDSDQKIQDSLDAIKTDQNKFKIELKEMAGKYDLEID